MRHTGVLTAVVAAFLLTAYSWWIGAGMPQWLNRPESLWVANVAAGERIVFEEPDLDVVVVGSSLAGRVPVGRIAEGALNLSFAAMSSVEGVELLERSGAAPRLLIVETNLIFRERDAEFVDQFFEGGVHHLHASLPAMRASYRPLNSLARISLDLVRLALGRPSRLCGDYEEAASVPERENPLLEVMVEREVADHEQVPSEQAASAVGSHLAAALGRLRGRGVEVVLVEVPVHPRVAATAHYRAVRGVVAQSLAKVASDTIEAPMDLELSTTDGLHLTPSSAARFADWLHEELKLRGQL